MWSGHRRRGVLCLLGWNALLSVVAIVLAALAGEAYFRLTVPFMRDKSPLHFVPNVGNLTKPNREVHSTNRLDFWNVSRTNSLGFLDREPPSPDRAAATCHISMIGDSFVEAKQVPIDDKFQVRVEELAAPHLNVTTSAFGLSSTGQIQQLPFYDEYARLLHPKLLVLVFVNNDFLDNSPVLQPLTLGEWDRKHFLALTVRRRSDGKLELRLPPPPSASIGFVGRRARGNPVKRSWLVLWLHAKKDALFPSDQDPEFRREVEALRRQPGNAALLEGWRPTTRQDAYLVFTRRDLPPFFEDALQYTRFALEQFRQRADRDGAKLVILASYTLTVHGTPMFERLSEMAATLDIPVIDQADYILRQGARLGDARWPHDVHWNPAGHRWAAGALLEYLEQRPEICAY